MDKRMEMSKSDYYEAQRSSHSKKSKKRSGKKSSVSENSSPDSINNQRTEPTSNIGLQPMFWPSSVQSHLSNHNGRLFTAMSDPSVCGYSPIPMTYTMEPVSLPPLYPIFHQVPMLGIKSVHNKQKQPLNQGYKLPSKEHMNANGYTSLQDNHLESRLPNFYQNGDYASLPPTNNKSSEIENDDLNSEHRRYSDPGLGPADTPDDAQNIDSDSAESSCSSITTIGKNNKFIMSLLDQMTELKKSNSQMFIELNHTKNELENVKAKLAALKYSASDYQPGMFLDLIHEIREANKSFEEGLIIKLKSTMNVCEEEKWKEVDFLKSQLSKIVSEKEESDRRIVKLEEEINLLNLHANNEGREIVAFEEENLALRRELQEARAARTLTDTHATKVENLVDMLRKKTNGATNEETLAEIRALVTGGGGQCASAGPRGPHQHRSQRLEDSCTDDEDDEARDITAAESSESSRTSETGANHSGPVTDL